MVSAGDACGADTGAALASVGIDPDCLLDPDARVAVDREQALWDELARRTGDECFGLHAQRHIVPGAVDVLDYAVRSSADLAQAIGNLIRYNRLVHDLVEFELRERDDEARIVHRHRMLPIDVSPQATDYCVGGLVIVLRELIGDDWTPTDVRVAHAPPRDVTPYAELLGVEPRFGGATNEIAFEPALLRRPIRTSDHRLHEVLARRAEALLESLPRSDDIVVRVREHIAESLCGGDTSIEAIAQKLELGPRTLQRRLADAGTTHHECLDAVRREMADDLLGGGEAIGISDIAYLLGYSERSAFHRAFKRWHGLTPAERRKELR